MPFIGNLVSSPSPLVNSAQKRSAWAVGDLRFRQVPQEHSSDEEIHWSCVLVQYYLNQSHGERTRQQILVTRR